MSNKQEQEMSNKQDEVMKRQQAATMRFAERLVQLKVELGADNAQEYVEGLKRTKARLAQK